jgi:urease accessory protein
MPFSFDKYKTMKILFILFCFFPSISSAHLFQGEAGGFLTGFEHPLSGLDHFLAMFSVGLWGAQIGGRSVWTLPVTFPLIMVVGGIMGIVGIALPAVEIGIALSIIVLGLAIVFSWKPSEWIVLGLICVFAICHGHAHGTELPNAASPADYAMGFVIATGLIHIIGIGVGLFSQKILLGKLTRALGALVVLGGVYFFSMAL